MVVEKSKSIGVLLLTALSLACVACTQQKNDWSPPWIAHDRIDERADIGTRLFKKHLGEAALANPDVLFLGDSIIANWETIGYQSWQKYFVPLRSYDLAIGGENTQATLWRLEHHSLDNLHPEVVVLMIGTNNLTLDSADDTFHGILAVIKQLQTRLPASQIMLLSVLPRGLTPSVAPLRKKIDNVNSKLRELQWTNVQFVSLASSVLQKDQTVDPLLLPDGIHPSERWYEEVSPEVARAIKKMMN